MMQPPTAVALLDLWETSLEQPLIYKSLRLLALACSRPDLQEMARLSIGERDGRLLQLREWLFGGRLINLAHCPRCSQPVEWESNLQDLYLAPLAPAEKEFELQAEGFHLRFRLLNSEDVWKALSDQACQADPNKLLAECILEVQHRQQPVGAAGLPDAVMEALQQRLEQEDPQADIQMLVDCPACGHRWEAPFDILSYLWVEIDNWARHVLQEVCLLARAFGWSEREILNMSPQRRQFYLDMLRS